MRQFWLGLLVLALAVGASGAEPPKSWRQMAIDALVAGDYDTATQYYQKWVEADPGDEVALYNLACCYAVKQRLDKALEALTQAAEAGWSDSSHTAADPDLAGLRSGAEFGTLLSRMAHNARMRSGGYITHTCAQRRMGRYLVVLPAEYDPARRYPLVVLLHGYAQTAQQFAEVAALINPHDYLYIVPEGSYRALDSEQGLSYLLEFDRYGEDTASVAAAASWVMDAAADAMARYPVDGQRVWLVGFSQGGALAHTIASLYPERIAGYQAHGSYLVPGSIPEERLAREKQAGVRVLITHGREDPTVPFDEALYAAQLFRRAGVNVELTELKVPHRFLPEVGMATDQWLKKCRNTETLKR